MKVVKIERKEELVYFLCWSELSVWEVEGSVNETGSMEACLLGTTHTPLSSPTRGGCKKVNQKWERKVRKKNCPRPPGEGVNLKLRKNTLLQKIRLQRYRQTQSKILKMARIMEVIWWIMAAVICGKWQLYALGRLTHLRSHCLWCLLRHSLYKLESRDTIGKKRQNCPQIEIFYICKFEKKRQGLEKKDKIAQTEMF